MKRTIRTTALALGVITLNAEAQLVVDSSMTVTQLVQNVLLGGGVTVSNVTYNGMTGDSIYVQVGSFDGTNCNLGMQSGVVMASGDIATTVGPNNNGASTLPPGGIGGAGDPDLDLTIPGYFTYDAAVVEFDFVPAGDSLSFNYVFGSEEYLEWVGSTYNDVFGFFISGPGISGPYSGNAANIALIPGTTTPVSINNVNNVNNSTYYVDNGDGFIEPNYSDPYYIQFDGFTHVLQANAIVQCGQPYHIKLAVADAGDPVLDSGVFLEAGSFSSPNAIELEVVTASADGSITEGCTDATLTITRPGDEDSLDVTVVVSGSATNGVDYTSVPILIIIPDGQTSVSFPVSAVDDGITEGMEEIILTATYVNACGDTSISSASIPIYDYIPIQLVAPDLALDCPDEPVPVTATATGGFENLYYLWASGETTSTIMVPGNESSSYQITVSDDCGHSVSDLVEVDAGCEVIIPNVFSPNGDHLNDEFIIAGIQGTENKVRIYNRWGQVVYEAQNYRNNWDAKDLPDGTYFYEVIVAGEPLSPYTGHLTIVGHND